MPKFGVIAFAVLVGLSVTMQVTCRCHAQESPGPASSVQSPDKSFENELEQLRVKYQLPALWAGKFALDGRSQIAVCGVRMWGNDTKAEVNDLVHIGSCTKAMTGLLIADLVSRGSLKFDTTLGEIFQNEPLVKDSTWADVTVTELLQHRSGAPSNAAWHELDAENPGDVVKARRAMLLKLVSQKRPKPSKFLYSNLGYALLGHVIETIEGKSWEELVTERLFQPLKMPSASFGPIGKAVDPKSVKTPEFAFGHAEDVQVAGIVAKLLGGQRKVKHKPVQIDNSPSLGPAGRVHIAIDDWSHFLLLFARNEAPKELNIRDDVWQTLLKPEFGGNYAGGWLLENRDWASGPTRWHNGSNTTWYCIAYALPEKGTGVIAVTNTYIEGSRDACEKAAELASRLELPSSR